VIWNIDVDEARETSRARFVFGRLEARDVVAKTALRAGDERRAADVLTAFGGRGVVRLIDHDADTVVLERLRPGSSLTSLVASGDDARATRVLADVIGRMSPGPAPEGTPTVADWSQAFSRHGADAGRRLPALPVDAAADTFARLAASQSRPRLLHGDLHHGNVLYDATRGWLAVDPKGVVGELEYEVGAALRNPLEHPRVFADAATIRRRLDRFARDLRLDRDRIAAWAFAQTVLALIWMLEDEEPVAPDHPWLTLSTILAKA
jgi:streptomycin 6-kinase